MEAKVITICPTAEDYVSLRVRSGMGAKALRHSQVALANSLFTASIYAADALIAFGRVVGDGGLTFVVSDIMVDKAYQRRGLGDKIMDAIDAYLADHSYPDSFICLIARRPADRLYHKHRFEYLPDERLGMLRKQE